MGSVLLKQHQCLFLFNLFNSVSVQKNKWDASRSLRFNQDAQREDGKSYYLGNIQVRYK